LECLIDSLLYLYALLVYVAVGTEYLLY
jgi:hypothetical protein